MSTYVWDFKPNNKVCSGLVPTAESYKTYLTDGDKLAHLGRVDPEKLFLVTEEKPPPGKDDPEGKIINVPKDFKDTEEGARHMCRAWYVKNGYGEKFCCQMERYKITDKEAVVADFDDEYDYKMNFIGPFSSAKASKQNMITFDHETDSYEVEYNAMILNARATMASLFALAAATAAYVN